MAAWAAEPIDCRTLAPILACSLCTCLKQAACPRLSGVQWVPRSLHALDILMYLDLPNTVPIICVISSDSHQRKGIDCALTLVG